MPPVRAESGRAEPSRYGRNAAQVAVYLALVPFFYALGSLPLAWLHRLSDLAAFLAHRVLRYRRAVVIENLRGCFPDAPQGEIERLAREGYRHAFDVVVETWKLLRAGPDAVAGRVEIDLGDALPLLHSGRSGIVALAHSGNWEWAIPAAVRGLGGVRVHVVYHPLRHAGFDRLFRELRERSGAIVTPMAHAMRRTARLRDRPTATFLVADQRARTRSAQTARFFGRDTAFFRGPERMARRLDLPLVFVTMDRVARGRYALRAEVLSLEPGGTAEGELTERFARRLEQQIRKAPENWLWTHRRWRDRRAERSERAQRDA